MSDELNTRRSFSKSKIAEIDKSIKGSHHHLDGKASIYVTGSYGRLEATEHSDLDAFILGEADDGKRTLSRLDEICVKADLIAAVRGLSIRDFDGDGSYLQHYTSTHLIESAGTPNDDSENTFTARLLLLLESRPLNNSDIHESAIGDVLAHYWRDYIDHKDDFIPAFLTNDILRLWRTFCVNYEARTRTSPVENKIKRRVKNFKLKHSRMITCFSAISFLLHIYETDKTVSLEKALQMTKLTPIERLAIISDSDNSNRSYVEEIIDIYDIFLKTTNVSEKTLQDYFSDSARFEDYRKKSYAMGDAIAALIANIGQGNRFNRLILI